VGRHRVGGGRDLRSRQARAADKRALGARAEAIVAAELERRGCLIVARNARVGRLEIDIVARRGRLAIFCEVRARARSGGFSPLETIDEAKTERIRRAAVGWMSAHGWPGISARFDAAAVTFDSPEGEIDYLEDAF